MFVRNLIIGSTLESQLYAFLDESTKLIEVMPRNYYDFEKLDFKIVNLDNRKALFSRLRFLNSMLGRSLFSEPGVANHREIELMSMNFSRSRFTHEMIQGSVSNFDSSGRSLGRCI